MIFVATTSRVPFLVAVATYVLPFLVYESGESSRVIVKLCNGKMLFCVTLISTDFESGSATVEISK